MTALKALLSDLTKLGKEWQVRLLDYRIIKASNNRSAIKQNGLKLTEKREKLVAELKDLERNKIK